MTASCQAAIQQWYGSVSGQNAATAVQLAVADMSNEVFGYYAAQVGELAGEYTLLRDSRIKNCFSIALDEQVGGRTAVDLVANPAALPLVFDNLDLVVVSHVLDCASSPHGVLREIERVLVPEGHCILIAFNPFSFRGLSLALKNLVRREDNHTLYTAFRVQDWFEVLGFEVLEVLEVRTVGRCYNVDRWPLLNRLTWLKWAMIKYSQVFGQVRLIHVRKKVCKLKPWKPKLGGRPILKPGMAVNTNSVNGHEKISSRAWESLTSTGKTVNNSKEHE